MSSTVLLEKPREETSRSAGGVLQILDVEAGIDNIFVTGGIEGNSQFADRDFQFDVNMTESGQKGNTLRLEYNFTFSKRSTRQVCRIRGKAVVRISQASQDFDFYRLGDEIQNQMAVEIFRKNYELVYLLHRSLGLEAPSPWITQDVAVSSRTQELAHEHPQATSGEEKKAILQPSL